MEKWAGKVVFLTGASAGIGEAIAEKLVDNGLKVVGFARRNDRLAALKKKCSSKKGKFYPYEGDVTKEEDILKAFQWIKETLGPVSILINNAGIMRISYLSESTTQDWKDTLDINVLAYCISTREAIKQMKDNHIDGHIININSIQGHRVAYTNKTSLYCASKHAVTALTETLRLELAAQDSKIRVTSLSPGLVKSDMLDKALKELALPAEAVNAMKGLEPSDVAEAVVYVLSTPKSVNITEITIQPVGEKF